MLQSIPSPDQAWQGIPLGEWLHAVLPFLPDAVASWQVRTYAVCILIGILIAAWLTGRRLRQRGVDSGLVFDVAVWAVILGIVAARIFHVITHPSDYLGDQFDLMRIIAVWEGGIAIFGALVGGAIGIWIGCRLTGLRFTTFVDALAPGLLLAQAAGRLGNYFNHELFGQPTDLPWGLEIEATNPAFPVGLPAETLFHPTFAYEIVWNVLGALLILWLDRRRDIQWGKAIALYLIVYGLGRSIWETIRIDPSEVFFGIRTNVWAAFLAIALGVIIWVVQSRRHQGLEPSPWQPGREPDDDAVDSDVYGDRDDPDQDPVSADDADTANDAEPASAST